MDGRFWLYFLSTLAFLASCSLFAKARKQEVFTATATATATSTAVLVIFLGNDTDATTNGKSI